ncbi:GNAT family N-acetyltransferase [Stenotrophomonas sp. HITSZ_GD]|uniref:GNAT family N-acetyltransferase n=1 Tax=Stenotrophomonas sp. HITSZ_GD TaxID=3037248 RepID=UPI00240E9288|nr:GNAT family N-acetyltransferase [Stenotrophomonas sp. HITSZ_GD]MDG2526450.1 GNAT family N-acetyltransferase [Stenotrophomonas sp. HITSZ_GD]
MGLEQLPADWRTVPTLQGSYATLEPLATAHADDLRAALGAGELSRLWYTNVPAPAQAGAYIDTALRMQADGQALPFAVRNAAGHVVGSTRLYDLQPDVPRLSIGYTFYALSAQRTGLNTEAKLMLLQYAFERLGCINVVFETSWFNHASRTAIARLGAKQDGVLRAHKRHADGSVRDTVIFSLLEAEWPAVRRHLQSRLEANA